MANKLGTKLWKRFVRSKARWVLEFLVVRLFVCVVQALPLSLCDAVAGAIGKFAYRVLKIRRKTTDDNLRAAFPEKSARQCEKLAEQMWRHLLLFVCEVAHVPRKLHANTWRRYVKLIGSDILGKALLDDRPVVVGSAHFGNFELCGYMLGLIGFETYSVARPLDNPYLNAYVARFRGLRGQKLIDKTGAAEKIAEVLGAGGTLCVLADQYAGRKGCWVEFFGRPASAHKAIAVVSIAHDAPLLVGCGRRIGGPLQYEVAVTAVADPRDDSPEVAGVRPLTQWYTTQLEQLIRWNPEQYWWLHDRWRSKGWEQTPEARRRFYKRNRAA